MDVLELVELESWDASVPEQLHVLTTGALENGRILFMPRLRFPIQDQESELLSPQFSDGKAKNISFDAPTGRLGGAGGGEPGEQRLKVMLGRYAAQARMLAEKLLPRYQGALLTGRTSFRPVEIAGRSSSYRKDDTRLHVDAFPATPVGVRRILRVFSNIHPSTDRVWRVGAPFEEVAQRFLPRARKQMWFEPAALRLLRITKTRRTGYDHAMLELHDRMKADLAYQSGVAQTEVRFPAGSTWIVFTDQVSHAAMSGQHALEQTFYLPVEAMVDSSRSPLRILERLSESRLV